MSKHQTSLRTHNCGELGELNIGETVTLCGWVQELQNRKLAFINLRDRFGLIQIIVDPQNINYPIAVSLKREDVIQVKGKIVERSAKNSAKNPKISTGEIEIVPIEIKMLNRSLTPPFLIEDKCDTQLDLRMKYRYLDIRRKPVMDALILRHKVTQFARNYLNKHDFLEIETPTLIKSTVGGARDFVVPSRMNPGEFYALPQSPQLFKQTLMVAGIDRYYQLARCYRDEELRADRQPEFTQIDCELSFCDTKDVINMFENMIKYIFRKIKNIEFEQFPIMEYSDAIKFYGIDKPDIRFEMKFVDITTLIKSNKNGFTLFDDAEIIVGFNVIGLGMASNSDIRTYINMSQEAGCNGLVWVKINEKITSSVGKYYSENDLKNWGDMFDAKNNDLLLIFAGQRNKTLTALGKFRLVMGDKLNLRDPTIFKPLWVINFPLFEWNEEENKFTSTHHPFTLPLEEDLPLLETDLGLVRSHTYDFVLNGVEVGGGSIRIHNDELQMLMFKHLGLTEHDANDQFGFLLNAFKYGAPPHGGIAFGLDRLCAMLYGTASIRDLIAFPKNSRGICQMIDAPGIISQKQLDELHIEVTSNK